MVLSYIYVMHFPINLCGVEDSVENYQTYLISCCEGYGVQVLWNHFFSICHSYLNLSHDFHAQLYFHSHFIFTAHTSLCCRNVEMSDRQAFRSERRQIAATDPI